MAATADPVEIPPPIRAMLDAAIASGNESEVSTIVKYARAADPASGDAVLKIADEWRAIRAKDRETRIERAGWLDLWTGRAELGGFVTTGNSDTAGVTGILDLTREGLEWRHKVRGQADFQRSLGITTREHISPPTSQTGKWTPAGTFMVRFSMRATGFSAIPIVIPRRPGADIVPSRRQL